MMGMMMMMGRRTVRMVSVRMTMRVAVRMPMRMAVRMVHQGERIVAVRGRDGRRRNASSCIGVRARSRGRLAAVGSRRRSGGCVVVVHDW